MAPLRLEGSSVGSSATLSEGDRAQDPVGN